MKRVILALLASTMLASLVSAQEASPAPSNAFSLGLSSTSILSYSGLNGSISFSHRFDANGLIQIGLSFFGTLNDFEDTSAPSYNQSQSSVNLNVDYIFQSDKNTFNPFIGIGLSGGVGLSTFYNLNQFNSYSYNYGLSFPFGVEAKLTENYRLGISSGIYVTYYQSNAPSNQYFFPAGQTITYKKLSFGALGPTVYFSLWF